MWVTVGGAGRETARRVEGEVLRIGSGPGADLRVEARDVAALHASIRTRDDGRVELHDEGAQAGVFVDGRRLESPVALSGAETIRIGEALLVLSPADPRGEPEPEPADDPEAAIEAIAAEGVAVSPARRRRASRAALAALRDARRSARLGVGLAAVALALALGAVALALSGVIGRARDERGSVTERIVAAAEPSTVLVEARGAGQRSRGSGFVLDADAGLVVTNFHVVGAGGELRAGRPGSMEDAELRAAAPCEDLAVLEIDPEGLGRSLPLGSQDALHQGDPVVALGFPAGASGTSRLTTTAGVVSAVRTPLRVPDAPRFRDLVQTDAALAPGNSGGPLVGEDGRLVGVNTALVSEIDGRPVGDQGYALGVDRVKEVLGDLGAGRSRGWFGAGLLFPPPALLERERLPDGVLAAAAFDGTSADDAGLEGVLIVAIDGRPLRSALSSYCDAVAGIESGESSELTVIADPRRLRPRRVSIEFE